MAPRKSCIAIKALPLLAWLLAMLVAGLAHAGQTVGTVTDLSGPLLARNADGEVKVLSQKSTVDQGDTLVSEKDTYARIKFVDNSEITLRPNTQFKIENFKYEFAKPENDNIVFRLVKGGLRSITGLLGKRNKEQFALITPAATIGIRGTIFIAEYVPPAQPDVAAYPAAGLAALVATQLDRGYLGLVDAPSTGAQRGFVPRGTSEPVQLAMADAPRSDAQQDFVLQTPLQPLLLAQNTNGGGSQGLNPGLYVQVLDGTIHVTNGGGTQNFSAGQFGFTPGFQQPPIILPTNPGMQFTPPPSFSTTSGSQGGTSGGKPGDVDCQVR
jgi:hypothetical protein